MNATGSKARSGTDFQGNCLPVLIGSLPLKDHRQATELILRSTPEIPLWPQLPSLEGEDMLAQFVRGMPGLVSREGKEFIDTESPDFDAQLLAFYERYMEVLENGPGAEDRVFGLDLERSAGFFRFMDILLERDLPLSAVKGQITGPITFGTGVKDQEGRAIFYSDQLRDAAVKLLAFKAAWQADRLARFQVPVLIFFDEPALAGFGSSEFISISKQDVIASLEEVMEPARSRQALVGVHVCANADWSVILESNPDILSFDAFAYFEKLVMYAQELRSFVDRGGIIAWGIVPTQDAAIIEEETPDSLVKKLQGQFNQLVDMGVDSKQLVAQSLITPSCGTGSLSVEHAERVLFLNQEVSRKMRAD